MKSGRTCTKITDFYTYVDEISDVVNGTDELREEINSNVGKESEDNVAPFVIGPEGSIKWSNVNKTNIDICI